MCLVSILRHQQWIIGEVMMTSLVYHMTHHHSQQTRWTPDPQHTHHTLCQGGLGGNCTGRVSCTVDWQTLLRCNGKLTNRGETQHMHQCYSCVIDEMQDIVERAWGKKDQHWALVCTECRLMLAWTLLINYPFPYCTCTWHGHCHSCGVSSPVFVCHFSTAALYSYAHTWRIRFVNTLCSGDVWFMSNAAESYPSVNPRM